MAERRVRGALVRGGANVPDRTLQPAGFSKIWDTDGFYDPGQRQVLTIPTSRRSGRYQIRVAVRWMNPWHQLGDPVPPLDELFQSYYYSCVTVNGDLVGNQARATAAAVPAATGTTQYYDVDANLRKKDKVGVNLWQSFGTEVMAGVHLEIRRLGPVVPEVTDHALPSPVSESAPIDFDW